MIKIEVEMKLDAQEDRHNNGVEKWARIPDALLGDDPSDLGGCPCLAQLSLHPLPALSVAPRAISFARLDFRDHHLSLLLTPREISPLFQSLSKDNRGAPPVGNYKQSFPPSS